MSTNSFVAIDEDPIADKRMAMRQRTVDSQVVQVAVLTLADWDSNLGAKVAAYGGVSRLETNARADQGATVTEGNPTVSGATRVQVWAADSTRRQGWITNKSLTATLWAGSATVVVGAGIAIRPQQTVNINGAARAAWSVIPSEALAAGDIAVLEEKD